MKKILILALIGVISFFASSTYAIICDNGVCGDADGDGNVNILDVALMINFYNCGNVSIERCEELGEIICEDNIDVNHDHAFTYADIEAVIGWLYYSGPELDCGF